MKHSDLSNFTNEELTSFKYSQLELDKLELLAQTCNDKEIPKELVDKLYRLCEEVLMATGISSISLPADKKRLTLANITEFLKFAITVKSFINAVIEIIQELSDHFKL